MKGRPEKTLDWNQLEKLARLPLVAEEIAWVLGVSVDTLSRRLQEQEQITCAEYLEQKRASIRKRLMAKQFDVAMKGNVTMLIWLGKQYLDQKDKAETVTKAEHTFPQVPADELQIRLEAIRKPNGNPGSAG